MSYAGFDFVWSFANGLFVSLETIRNWCMLLYVSFFMAGELICFSSLDTKFQRSNWNVICQTSEFLVGYFLVFGG